MNEQAKKDIYLIIHDVRSIHNVGSMFRTADAAGVKKVYLTGYTSAPVDRFGRLRADLHKTALGAEESVSWEYVGDIFVLIDQLKKENVHIIALEQSPDSVDYKKVGVRGATALIVGNEVGGISADILEKADFIVEIPMRGAKESLNVSVATGIMLFTLRDF